MSSTERGARTFAGYSLLVSTDGREKRFQLTAGENVIGSLPDNQIVLLASGVSRRHAALDVGAASITLRDLKSKNGTFLNGKAVRSAAVGPGDSIELGKAKLRIEEIDPDDAELALVLTPTKRRAASSFPFRDTTRVVSAKSTVGLEDWPFWLEDLIDRLCLVPPDIHGTLRVLLREIGMQSAVLLELPKAAEALVLATVGNLEEERLEEGLEVCTEHLARAIKGGRLGCSSFRVEGCPAVCGSVLLGSEEALGLLLFGSQPNAKPIESLLRFLLRLFSRLAMGGQVEARPAARVAAAAELVFPDGYVPGKSGVMSSLYAQMRPLLAGILPVLIVGETGVGKEYFAKILHRSSVRCEGPFIAINCAAIPGDLLESELFGIEQGVATGVVGRAGKFSLADGGTLFLDEIGDLAVHLQAKLLRALQEGEIHPVGGSPMAVDVRVVSSTNIDLKAEAEEGHFRLDLYYRLAGYTLVVPPLRERREDIFGLVEHFVQQFSRAIGKPIRGVTVKVLRALKNYAWPGNVRELEHEISRLVYACQESQPIESTLLSPHVQEPLAAGGRAWSKDIQPGLSMTLNLAEIEKRAIKEALAASQHKLIDAAGLLGISRDALRRRMDRYGLLAP